MAVEYKDRDGLVIQADLPGINPDRDVEVWITNDVLHIRASRPLGPEPQDHSSDLRYGSLSRDIALPAGTTEDHIQASYHDGQLEIRAPIGDPVHANVMRVPVAISGSSGSATGPVAGP